MHFPSEARELSYCTIKLYASKAESNKPTFYITPLQIHTKDPKNVNRTYSINNETHGVVKRVFHYTDLKTAVLRTI